MISSLFHLIVPVLGFLCAYSKHDNLYLVDRVYEISNKVVPLYLAVTLIAYFGFNFIGMGSVTTLLIYVCALDKALKKPNF